jgi:hypothetical protein
VAVRPLDDMHELQTPSITPSFDWVSKVQTGLLQDVLPAGGVGVGLQLCAHVAVNRVLWAEATS